MAILVIRCPATDQDVSTGIAIDRDSFEVLSRQIGGRAMCPHCATDHDWTKDDAWIVETPAVVEKRRNGHAHRAADPLDCRDHADRCITLAQSASRPELKASLMELATTWTKLAIELERTHALLDDDSLPLATAR